MILCLNYLDQMALDDWCGCCHVFPPIQCLVAILLIPQPCYKQVLHNPFRTQQSTPTFVSNLKYSWQFVIFLAICNIFRNWYVRCVRWGPYHCKEPRMLIHLSKQPTIKLNPLTWHASIMKSWWLLLWAMLPGGHKNTVLSCDRHETIQYTLLNYLQFTSQCFPKCVVLEVGISDKDIHRLSRILRKHIPKKKYEGNFNLLFLIFDIIWWSVVGVCQDQSFSRLAPKWHKNRKTSRNQKTPYAWRDKLPVNKDEQKTENNKGQENNYNRKDALYNISLVIKAEKAGWAWWCNCFFLKVVESTKSNDSCDHVYYNVVFNFIKVKFWLWWFFQFLFNLVGQSTISESVTPCMMKTLSVFVTSSVPESHYVFPLCSSCYFKCF